MAIWQLWADMGGTFTDCIASDPSGNSWHFKVLSSGTLRGRVVRLADKATIEVSFLPQADIYKGYTLRFASAPELSIEVTASHMAKNILVLNHLPEKLSGGLLGATFELSAGEEAPLLAARIATQTPLRQALPPLEMRLGTTKATNALLEHKTARTALLITKGFADLLHIGTQQRPDIFAMQIPERKALYHCVIEVDERLNAQGEILKSPDKKEIDRIVQQLKETQTEAVAVSFMHSYLNPVHEEYVVQSLEELGFKAISAGSRLARAIRFLPRTSTALINASLSPVTDQYLHRINSQIQRLQLMTSTGGLVNARYFQPKDSLLSGPAGGVNGAALAAARSGINRFISLDMGGTSADVARYDQAPFFKTETTVGNATLLSPSLAIETVAAGGGSICMFDGFKLCVGPESAGARPGPACYGMGGPLTLTDVNLLAGRLDASAFGIPIQTEAAESALRLLMQQIKQSTGHIPEREDILAGLLQIAEEKMAEAIRKISVSQGYHPHEYTLLAFGGAGGLHACAVAQLMGIREVLIPAQAGILSAWGIGMASAERIVSRQLLAPLSEIEQSLEQLSRELAQEASRLLIEEEYCAPAQLAAPETWLELRYKGQESSIEVNYQPSLALASLFTQRYHEIFGHILPNRTIEAVAIRVRVRQRQNAPTAQNETPPVYRPHAQGVIKGRSTPVYHIEKLKSGALLNGAALLLQGHSTVWVPQGWQLFLDQAGNLLLRPQESKPKTQESQEKHVRLSLFTNRFRAIAEEMGAQLQRTSLSVNVKERLDFSCALLDHRGELVVNAPHVPVHLGSLGLCVRTVLEHLQPGPNDVIITNHPAYGGSHLPDITLIAPVYAGKQLVAYVANRAHHAEVGGSRPGSMPPSARKLAEEGVVIPPVFLVRNGEAQWEQIEQLFTQGQYPSRSPEENIADLRAALASIRTGVQQLQRLCARHSPEVVMQYMQALQNHAAACMKQCLSHWPSGKYIATEHLDDGTKLQVHIESTPEYMNIDFEGSGQTHTGNMNATPAIVRSVVMYVLRVLAGHLLPDEDLPLNEGLLQNVQIHLPDNSILNPRFNTLPELCPAVVGGNTETSQRLTDTLLKALKLMACSQGTMNNLIFGNSYFGYYETIGGGSGAGNGFHGFSGVHHHMTNTRITDPELMEYRYPVQVLYFGIRHNSGGKGHYNGGNGLRRELQFLAPVALSVLTQHRNNPPYGMAGGEPGSVGTQYIKKTSGAIIDLASIDSAEAEAGDILVMLTPGGGGYGHP